MKQKNWANLQKLIGLMIAIITFGLLLCGDMPPLDINHMSNVKPIYEFKASDAEIMSIALSSKQDFLVIGTIKPNSTQKYGGVSIWPRKDWHNKKLTLETFNNHKLEPGILNDYSTQELAISSNDEVIIARSDDYVWKWDKKIDQTISIGDQDYLTINKPEIVLSSILPNKNKIIINQQKRGGIRGFFSKIAGTIIDLESGKEIEELTGANESVIDWSISPDGNFMGTILKGGYAVIWDLNERKMIKDLNFKKGLVGKTISHVLYHIALSDNYIVTIGEDLEIKLLSRASYNEIKRWKVPYWEIREIKISPNEKYIVFRTHDKGLMGIISIENGKFVTFNIAEHEGTRDWPSVFIISHNSKALIVGDGNGMIRIFDIQQIMGEKSEEKSVIDLPAKIEIFKQLSSPLISLSMK